MVSSNRQKQALSARWWIAGPGGNTSITWWMHLLWRLYVHPNQHQISKWYASSLFTISSHQMHSKSNWYSFTIAGCDVALWVFPSIFECDISFKIRRGDWAELLALQSLVTLKRNCKFRLGILYAIFMHKAKIIHYWYWIPFVY